MRTYTITLKDGTTFIAERGWREEFDWDAWDLGLVFRNLQGAQAPALNADDKLIIPRTSILYMVKSKK